MTMLTKELLPCPFCGGAAGDDDLPDSVYCTDCGAETPRYLWNRRAALLASSQEPGAELERVRLETREECAKVCETHPGIAPFMADGRNVLAEAIRSLSTPEEK